MFLDSMAFVFFRMYTLRKVRDTFKSNKHITNAEEIGELLATGKENLAMLQRQVFIFSLPLVVFWGWIKCQDQYFF